MDEVARIAMLAKLLGRAAAGVEVGIGDDAAVLAAGADGSRLVWTIDEQVEGTHFRRDLLSWQDVGYRSLMAATSDIAAMGARPLGALAAVVLPEDVRDEDLAQIARGQADAAVAIATPIIGGNLARGPVVSLATTVLGLSSRPILRSGARVGEGVWLAGPVGLASAGLAALEQGRAEDGRLRGAVSAWRRPLARLADGEAMREVASAAIDVSDGLARDLGHVAEASGVCIVIEERAIVADAVLVEAARVLGREAVDLALHGGEDYALVATSRAAITGFRRIGEVAEGRGLVLRGPAGDRALEALGFDHFAG
jgi:thiamine-monophosphate kinase